MKKVLLSVFCAAFFAFCAFFSLGMLLPGASSAAEGASLPSLIADGGVNQRFGDDFESYFSKSFAFRSNVVDTFSSLRENLFETGNDQVTVGKNGFLFFTEAVKTYTGASKMTEDELSAAVASLSAMADYASSHGARFLFVPAPNKATVYPEMLPERLDAAEVSDLDRLFAALNETEVDYVDLRPILASRKDSYLLYHKRDTHWNGRGAFVAFEAIASELGVPLPETKSFIESEDFEGDLDSLLYPGTKRYDRNEFPNLSGQYVYTSSYSTPMDMVISTRGSGEKKALVFRDSFANAMIPCFAAAFSEAKFERANPYRLNLLNTYHADAVVVIIAERNLRDLAGCDSRISE